MYRIRTPWEQYRRQVSSLMNTHCRVKEVSQLVMSSSLLIKLLYKASVMWSNPSKLRFFLITCQSFLYQTLSNALQKSMNLWKISHWCCQCFSVRMQQLNGWRSVQLCSCLVWNKAVFRLPVVLMRFWISFLGWLIRKEHGTSTHYNSAANGNNSITSIISYNNTGGTL